MDSSRSRPLTLIGDPEYPLKCEQCGSKKRPTCFKPQEKVLSDGKKYRYRSKVCYECKDPSRASSRIKPEIVELQTQIAQLQSQIKDQDIKIKMLNDAMDALIIQSTVKN